MLLEHRLALELQARDFVQLIIPVFAGDADAGGVHAPYFATGCAPSPPPHIIDAVEAELEAQLDKQGLGTPVTPAMTVSEVWTALTRNQGVELHGPRDAALNLVVEKTHAAVQAALLAESVAHTAAVAGPPAAAGSLSAVPPPPAPPALLRALSGPETASSLEGVLAVLAAAPDVATLSSLQACPELLAALQRLQASLQ